MKIIFLYISFSTIFFCCTNNTAKTKYSDSDIENKYEIALAIIDENTNPPTEFKIAAFRGLLDEIEKLYVTTTDKNISDAMVASYNILKEKNYSNSLFAFGNGFIAFYNNMGNVKERDFEKAFALYAWMINNN